MPRTTLASTTIALLALTAGPGPVEGKKPEPVTKAVRVTGSYKAEWEKDIGSVKSKGRLTINIDGRLGLNKGFSSASYGLPAVLLPYAIENARAEYDFEQTVTQANPPEGCPGLLEEYRAKGRVDLPVVPGPGSLLIFNTSGIMKDKRVWRLIPAAKKELMIDRYELVLPGKEIEASGKKRPRSKCLFKGASRKIKLGSISVSAPVDGGQMKGKRSWSAKANGLLPTFQIGVSLLPAKLKKKPYSPEKKDDGEVSYSLRWDIKEAAAVEIERRVKGKWHVLTEALKDVVAGERIELRGVVLPKRKDPRRGTWTVGDAEQPSAVKRFDARQGQPKQGRPIYLADNDLNTQIVRFHWFKRGRHKVAYRATVDGSELEKEVVFTVKKPEYTVSWEIGDASRMVKRIDGTTLPLFKKWSRSSWPPTRPHYGKEGLGGKISGLQFDGILFTARNESKDTMPGKTQWVQLIRDTQISWEGGDKTAPCSSEGLDHLYPCAVNESFFDAPAIPTNHLGAATTGKKVEMVFKLYVMFKPRAAGSEWVTVKRIDWRWTGMINKIGSAWEKDPSVTSWSGKGGASPPTSADDDTYPEWSQNSAGFRCQ